MCLQLRGEFFWGVFFSGGGVVINTAFRLFSGLVEPVGIAHKYAPN